jgi:hypothetical protein
MWDGALVAFGAQSVVNNSVLSEPAPKLSFRIWKRGRLLKLSEETSTRTLHQNIEPSFEALRCPIDRSHGFWFLQVAPLRGREPHRGVCSF